MYSNKLGGGHEAGCRRGQQSHLDLFSIIYNMGGKKHKKINIEMKLPSGRWLRMPGFSMVGMCPCHLSEKIKACFKESEEQDRKLTFIFK